MEYEKILRSLSEEEIKWDTLENKNFEHPLSFFILGLGFKSSLSLLSFVQVDQYDVEVTLR